MNALTNRYAYFPVCGVVPQNCSDRHWLLDDLDSTCFSAGVLFLLQRVVSRPSFGTKNGCRMRFFLISSASKRACRSNGPS